VLKQLTSGIDAHHPISRFDHAADSGALQAALALHGHQRELRPGVAAVTVHDGIAHGEN